MNEALLLATMCIIGLPVDVLLKDGSVYSGTFHTASVEKEYGIVLKKAKLTKKGRCATNVANGIVVETLVILAGDLGQVVAKGVPFPFDGLAGNIAHGNREAAFEILPSSSNPLNEIRKFNKSTMDKRKSNRKSKSSVQNENDFADGFIVTKSGKEHEYRKVLQNSKGNAKEVEYQRTDGTNIEQDLVQGAVALPPVPSRPLAPHHLQNPKHQGNAPGQAFQLCVPQPFIAGGQQPLAVPKLHSISAAPLPC